MVQSNGLRKFKLAAIDLDGTLLGPDGTISAENAAAVRRLQHAGVHVVLASGRHYKTMRPYVDALPGVEWIISCQGGELCDVNRTEILTGDFLSSAQARETYETGTSLGSTTVAYSVDGVFTDSDWNDDLQFYFELAGYRPINKVAQEIFSHQIFKLIWISTPEATEWAVQEKPAIPDQVQMIRTQSRFLEFMPTSVSKASALKLLAARLGIQASESLAFGDGDNDVPMFEWAGVSVAMPHGWPAAWRKATYTAPAGPAETALARGIDLMLRNQINR